MGDTPNIAALESSLTGSVPPYSETLFAAKARKRLTFAQIGEALNRSEVGVAAVFYGQARSSQANAEALASLLDIPLNLLLSQGLLTGFPDRGRLIGGNGGAGGSTPREPLVYRLYEIVQNYGYALKAVMNEKFGDGIMSAIAFSAKVDKEVDSDGVTWANITLRGKWLPYTRF